MKHINSLLKKIHLHPSSSSQHRDHPSETSPRKIDTQEQSLLLNLPTELLCLIASHCTPSAAASVTLTCKLIFFTLGTHHFTTLPLLHNPIDINPFLLPSQLPTCTERINLLSLIGATLPQYIACQHCSILHPSALALGKRQKFFRVKTNPISRQCADRYYNVEHLIHPDFAINAFLQVMALHHNGLPTTEALSRLHHFSSEKRTVEEWTPEIPASQRWPRIIPYRIVTLSTPKLITHLPSPKIDRKGQGKAIERSEEEEILEKKRIASEVFETGDSHLLLRTQTWFLFASRKDWVASGVGVGDMPQLAEALVRGENGDGVGYVDENDTVSSSVSSPLSTALTKGFEWGLGLEMKICPHKNANNLLFHGGPCMKLYRNSKRQDANDFVMDVESSSETCGCQSCKVDWTCPFCAVRVESRVVMYPGGKIALCVVKWLDLGEGKRVWDDPYWKRRVALNGSPEWGVWEGRVDAKALFEEGEVYEDGKGLLSLPKGTYHGKGRAILKDVKGLLTGT